MKYFLFVFILFTCSRPQVKIQNQFNDPQFANKPYVLLISIDGYRYDYTKLYKPKNISEYFKTSSKGLIPVYPSKTFPNHYSIITGMYAGKHGIIANRFWDRERQQQYRLGDRETVEDGSWYGGTPIWTSLNEQKMLTASYFWVGSEANIKDDFPTYYYRYNHNTPNRKRVDQVINWLKLPKAKRPHFITLYFSDVDSAGHKYGPRSQEVAKAVHSVDKELGYLFNEVQKENLDLNIILVSDHGMKTIDKHIYLSDYIEITDDIRIEGKGPHANLYIKNNTLKNKIYKKLSDQSDFKVFQKNNLPKDFHYYNKNRTGDLVLSMSPGVYLHLKKGVKSYLSKPLQSGTHGYIPSESKKMRGIFYAQGPQIIPKGEIEAFENIHIYPFIMNILGMEISNDIDGQSKVLGHLIK